MTSVASSILFLEVNRGILARGFRVRFPAPGHSMHPTIRDGEVIVVEPVSPKELNNKDIILYSTGRGLIAHRVVEIEKRNLGTPVFLTRGDAAGSSDESVQHWQVLGRAIAVERNGHTIDLTTRRARISHSLHVCVSVGRAWASRVKRIWRSRAARNLAKIIPLAAFCVTLPTRASAVVAVTQFATSSFMSGNDCSITSIDASTLSPNLILLAIALHNGSVKSAPVFNTTPSQTFAQIGTAVGTNNKGVLLTGLAVLRPEPRADKRPSDLPP